MRRIPAQGSPHAKIMIVGTFPSWEDEKYGRIFSGNVGDELSRMLHEAKFIRSECYLTNVVKFQPPRGDISQWVDFRKKQPEGPYTHHQGAWTHHYVMEGINELRAEIRSINPNLIITCGELALWAVTGERSITSWRGSILRSLTGHKVLATYHPADVSRNWEWRPITVHDLRRARAESSSPTITEPEFDFIVRPSFERVIGTLDWLTEILDRGPTRLAIDVETRNQDLACVGIAWSTKHAICIPIQSITHDSGHYWSLDEHVEIRHRLKALLTHPNCLGVGQNFSYDLQYFSRRMLFLPNICDDTMVAQHVLFPGTPKGLDYLSSLYCSNHVYWKDEGKEWDPRIHDEERYWRYNCIDCVRTFEIIEQQEKVIEKEHMLEQYRFQMSLIYPVDRMTTRGVRIDLEKRGDMAKQLFAAIAERQRYINYVVGRPLNIRSPKQMQEFLYEEMQLPPITKRGKRRKDGTTPITTDKDALDLCASRLPILQPIVDNIHDMRTMGIYLSTFVNAPIDEDGKIRCTFQSAGPETYRFSSYENSFGTGTNLQNIPRLPDDGEVDKLPPIRNLFIPDEGYEIGEADLSGADAMVVAEESDDDILREIMAKRLKLAAENAKMIYGSAAGPDGKKEPYYTKAKAGAHAANYGAQNRTIARVLGETVHEADKFLKRWFGIHPNIKKWQQRVENELQIKRMVSNAFGYRRIYFDRIEELLGQALAWIPQSTVACIINRALVAIDAKVPTVQILMQVHDSLVFQYRIEDRMEALKGVYEGMRVVVPYPRPLIIVSDLKTSIKSWGECVKTPWPV